MRWRVDRPWRLQNIRNDTHRSGRGYLLACVGQLAVLLINRVETNIVGGLARDYAINARRIDGKTAGRRTRGLLLDLCQRTVLGVDLKYCNRVLPSIRTVEEFARRMNGNFRGRIAGAGCSRS